MSLGPEAAFVWRRWSALVVVGALLLAAAGIWEGDRLTRRLAHPEHTDTLREIGRAIASDLERAQRMGIPLDEAVGLEPWFAAQVKGSTVLSGLALTLPSGKPIAQHGLDPAALATHPQPDDAASQVRPWVTLEIDNPQGGGPAGRLHVAGTRQGVSLPGVWGTLVLALALAALASWVFYLGLLRHLTRPLERIAFHLDCLSRGASGPLLPPATGGHPVALLDQALAQQRDHLSQWNAALLQKLNEVRAAHFDPGVLARIDELALPLLADGGQAGPLSPASPTASAWARLSLNRRIGLVLLAGGVVALGCAWALLEMQGKALRQTRATHEALRVQRALQTALALDQARAEPLLQAHTVLSLLRQGPASVVPVLPPGAQLWVHAGGHTATAAATPDVALAPPERGVTDALQPQAAPVQGIWAATDHGLHSGVAHSLVLPDGTAAVAVLAQPLAGTLARMARDLNARWALADHRGQPLGADAHQLVDRWRQAGRAPSWSDSDTPALLLAVPLNSYSGHTLGHWVVSLPPDTGAAPSSGGLQVLAVVAMLSALALAMVMVHRQLRPLGRAAGQLSRLAENPGADAVEKGGASVHINGLQHDIARLENRLDMLRALRRSRERQGRRQARFIRHQMMTLAERLDDTARRGVLEDLHRIEQASHTESPGELRVSGPEADPRFERMVDEVGVLALGFQNLVGRVGDQYQQLGLLVHELREALRVKTQFIAIQQELEIARKMQLSILPHNFGDQAGVALHGTMLPAREVGGDFYDFFRLDEHHLALVVADVSGKGVPAAFFMAVSRTLLRAVAQFSQGPADCLRRLNDLLAADNDEMMFVTLFYAVIDTRSGQVVYGNAGHNPPYVVRADGRVEPVPGTGNMALAVMEDLPFDERQLHLHPGDALFMYTDGVTEASDPAQALFGEPRLEAFLSGHQVTPVQEVNRELVAAIKVFEAGGAQADDITCLMVRRDPAAPSPTP